MAYKRKRACKEDWEGTDRGVGRNQKMSIMKAEGNLIYPEEGNGQQCQSWFCLFFQLTWHCYF